MRVPALFLIVFVTLVGATGISAADKVKTNQEAKLYNRPGEQGKVILKVKEGQAMTVISKDGRWLKVRVQGRTGYVPRSKVDVQAEEIVRNTRRRPFVDGRGTRRGPGEGAPGDRVGADATDPASGTGDDTDASASDDDDKKVVPAQKKTAKATKKDDDDEDDKKTTKVPPKKPAAKVTKKGDDDEDDKKTTKKKTDDDDDEPKSSGDDDKVDDEPKLPSVKVSAAKTKVFTEKDGESDVAFTAGPDDSLILEEPVDKATKGEWTFVQNKEGDAGYVKTTMLDLESSSDESGPAVPTTRQIGLLARLGFSIISQSMTSVGGAAKSPDNFELGTSSVTLALGGSYVMPYGKYLIGAEAALDLNKGLGISYTDPMTMAKTSIGFSLYNFNLHFMGGYPLKSSKRGTVLWARVGYHYQALQIADANDPAKNTAMMPSENVKGPTIGVAATIPKLTDKIGLRFSLDLMLIGASLDQTKNLEDGANPSASGECLGTAFTYHFKSNLDIQATYDYNRTSLSWGAPVMSSARIHTGTAASRGDGMHTLALGVVRAF